MPEAGEALLTPEVGSQRGPNFLREELAERLARGPASFRLSLQVAADGDPTDDPTALWPADRPTAELGRLEIGSISPTSAADEQRLIFEKFGRVGGQSSKPGTGLGLYIARSIAEAHGGSLDVSSLPGRGTTFTLTLPTGDGA